MTREEKQKAIDALKMSAPLIVVTQEEFKDYIQTLNKIMDWLEQEPTTKDDLGVDCISRQAVIDNAGLSEWFDSSDSYNEFVFALNELPSVTPQEPKGHWIGHREHCENLGVMPSGLGAYEWCSNCDCGIDVMEWHRNHYNYCPNCGAKMIEPHESEG